MLAEPGAIGIEDGPGLRRPAASRPQLGAVVAAGHEADLLALGLVGRDESQAARDLADLGLAEVAQREAAVPQLVLAQAVEEVGLVLRLVGRPGEHGPRPVRRLDDAAAGVVAGGDGLAAVEVPGATQEGAELDDRVAVDARAGRPALEVGGDERLDDAGRELPLQVHDVERDPEPGGDAPGIVGGIRGAAALPELGVAVGDVVEAHPDADDLVALLVQQGGRDRAVHAPGHRDEDPAHPATASDGCGTASIRRRSTSGTMRAASSISASVVVRPSDSRSAPRASSAG